MLFGKHSPTVLTGDDHGTVTLYKLRNLNSINANQKMTAEEQAKILLDIVGEKNGGIANNSSSDGANKTD